MPEAISRLFVVPNDDPGCDTLEAFDNINGLANWNGVTNGLGIMLPAASGLGTIELCYEELDLLPRVPFTTVFVFGNYLPWCYQ